MLGQLFKSESKLDGVARRWILPIVGTWAGPWKLE
jgi:hypothetical protein